MVDVLVKFKYDNINVCNSDTSTPTNNTLRISGAAAQFLLTFRHSYSHEMQVKIIRRYKFSKSNVKRIAEYVIGNENQKLVEIPGLQAMRNKSTHLVVRIAWFLIIFISLTTCIYQIGSRIEYCVSKPTVVDVFYKDLSDGKMPRVTITTQDTEAMMQFIGSQTPPILRSCLQTLPNLLPIEKLNVTVDKLWLLLNTTTIIKEGYITRNGRRFGNLNLREYNGVGGVMTELYYDKSVQLRDTSFKMHVKLNYPNLENETMCNNPPLVVTIQSGDETSYDLSSMTVLAVFRNNMVGIEVKKYVFLNTMARPCVAREIFETCENECYQSVYVGLNQTCRFPFVDKTDIPFCKTSRDTLEHYSTVMNLITDFNPRIICNCPTPCSKTQQTNLVHIDDTESEHIQLYIQSSEARVMVERFAYSYLSLLCDIGGNLGLYLGLSLLSTVQLIIQSLRQRNRRLNPVKSQFFKKVTQIYQSEKRKQEGDNGLKEDKVSGLKMKNWIKYFVTGLAIILCIYQTSERIAYFFSYPISISIAVVEETEIQLPSIVICYLPPSVLFAKKMAAKKMKKDCEDVDTLDLLDPPHKYKNDIEKLWLETSTISSFQGQIHQSMLHGNLTTYPTFLGNCTKSSIHAFKYSAMKLLLTVSFSANNMCNCDCKIFTIPVGEQFDLLQYTELPCIGKTESRFTRQSLIRLALPKKPCMTREDSINCRENCFKNKMMAKIKCRLPFMINISLPLCDSSESAKQSRQDYLDSYMSTNPLKECNYYPRCNETVYVPYTTYDESMATLPVTMAAFGLRNNVHEIIKQNRAFPVIKLLCDIGSNLGFIVGMSVLSLIEVTKETIYFTKNALIKRYA